MTTTERQTEVKIRRRYVGALAPRWADLAEIRRWAELSPDLSREAGVEIEAINLDIAWDDLRGQMISCGTPKRYSWVQGNLRDFLFIADRMLAGSDFDAACEALWHPNQSAPGLTPNETRSTTMKARRNQATVPATRFDASSPVDWNRLADVIRDATVRLDALPDDTNLEVPLGDALDSARNQARRLLDAISAIFH